MRKSLIESGSARKYLLYAIGEILLVMIGILLALQVNNWNERRTTDEKVVLALLKLKQDISNDLESFKRLDSTYATWHEQAVLMLSELGAASKRELSSFEDFVVGRGSMNHLSITTTTLEEMTSTGLLYQISNPDISRAIVQYYGFAQTELQKLNLDNQEFYRYVLTTGAMLYINTVRRLDDKVNLEYIDWSWLQDPSSERYMSFEGRLGFHRHAIEVNRDLIRELTKQALTVLDVLK